MTVRKDRIDSLPRRRLRLLAKAACEAVGVSPRHIFWKNGHPKARLARRLFVLHAHAALGQPFPLLASFLGVHRDRPRMMLVTMKGLVRHGDLLRAIDRRYRELEGMAHG
jgi:hypothetical protein